MNRPALRPDRQTVHQLLQAARADTDRVSVFHAGSTPADTKETILVIKDHQVAAGVISMLMRQRLLTAKPVERAPDVDVTNPATCSGCGCTDRQACSGGCYWLAVDRADRTGVCSSCRTKLDAWRNQRVPT